MLTTGLRSYQRGTLSLCRSKGCKVTVRQTVRMLKNSGLEPWAELEWCDSGQEAEVFVKPQTFRMIKLSVTLIQACFDLG